MKRTMMLMLACFPFISFAQANGGGGKDREEGLRYFYPGPVIISNDRLDYKLSFDREHVEVFLSSDGVWEPFRKHGKAGMEKYLFKKNMDIDFDDIFPDEGKEGQG